VKITKFYKEIPECQEKPFVCNHKTCKLWAEGYRVSMRKFWIFKWLVWKQPAVQGDAIRTQMLKEAGLTWEDYAKAMLSLEEFLALVKKIKEEGKKSVYKDNYYKHHSKRLELRKKYYKKEKEQT